MTWLFWLAHCCSSFSSSKTSVSLPARTRAGLCMEGSSSPHHVHTFSTCFSWFPPACCFILLQEASPKPSQAPPLHALPVPNVSLSGTCHNHHSMLTMNYLGYLSNLPLLEYELHEYRASAVLRLHCSPSTQDSASLTVLCFWTIWGSCEPADSKSADLGGGEAGILSFFQAVLMLLVHGE